MTYRISPAASGQACHVSGCDRGATWTVEASDDASRSWLACSEHIEPTDAAIGGGTMSTTMAAFIEREQIRAYARVRASNPAMDETQPDDRHWAVTLSRPGAKMVVPFTQGSAHTEPPTADDVLDCLASDASGYDNARDFEDWASEYGYETDSRRAERTYRAIGEHAGQLRAFLGAEAYRELVSGEVERL